MREHLSQAAQSEYGRRKYDQTVNALVGECRERKMLNSYTTEDEALLRSALALDIATRREPQRKRTPAERELIEHFQKLTAKFSGTPSFEKVSGLATDLVTVLYSLEPLQPPAEATIRAVQSLKDSSRVTITQYE